MAGAGPVDRLVLRTPRTFRRRLLGGAAIAVLVLAVVSGSLAWNQYRHDQRTAVSNLHARVTLTGLVVDTALSGGLSTLESVAQAPSVMDTNPALMGPYFRRVDRTGSKLFTGGISWSNTLGYIMASSSGGSANISDRTYFQQALATRRPYISAGLIGKKSGKALVVVAIPTFDANGDLSGVLTGGIRLGTLGKSNQTQDLGLDGLTIVDRNGRLILGGLARAQNPGLLAKIRAEKTGVVKGTAGLQGGSNRIVAFSTAPLPDWTIAIDRPESSVYGAARHSLLLDLASLAAAVVFVLAILTVVVRRSGRQIREEGQQAQSWSRLTRSLAAAATPADIADAIFESVKEVFGDAVIVVSVHSETGEEVRAGSSLPGWRRLPGDADRLTAIAELTHEGPRSWSLERRSSLRDLYLAFGRGLRALHGVPIRDSNGAPAGGIGLLTERGRLEPSEWELLGAFAAQAARSLERARAFEHEHEVAFRLQQSLLPAELPVAPGLTLAGEYAAGGTGVDVGGDWYDAVLRPDGTFALCVGDVSGRGVGAATVMGRQRSTFRAYAYDCGSPAEILRRMVRHVDDDEMTTVACISIDPLEGLLVYSSAGHPPPLLLDRDSGEVVRLEDAIAPPLGVAEPADVIERSRPLPPRASLAMYTDGLVERRGESIEEGIGVLGRTMAARPEITARELMSAISEAIGAPADDVALLLASIEPASAFDIELAGDPEVLPGLRRRLRTWLGRQGFEAAASDVVLAVSEAINNAIEHAYRKVSGTVRLEVSAEGNLLRVQVSDRGHWFVSESNDERGRGILLMNSLMDSVEIESNGGGTTVTLERRGRAQASSTQG
jgi:anti-sigma regulatory factor (Ser/Thr protein kinase)